MELYLRKIVIYISRSLAYTKIITLLMAFDGNFHYMGLYRRASRIVPFFMPADISLGLFWSSKYMLHPFPKYKYMNGPFTL